MSERRISCYHTGDGWYCTVDFAPPDTLPQRSTSVGPFPALAAAVGAARIAVPPEEFTRRPYNPWEDDDDA